jgi:hypothetical protein
LQLDFFNSFKHYCVPYSFLSLKQISLSKCVWQHFPSTPSQSLSLYAFPWLNVIVISNTAKCKLLFLTEYEHSLWNSCGHVFNTFICIPVLIKQSL